MISQTTEYALRAIVYLADNREGLATADKISAVTKVPVGYLSKIMQGLVRAGLISSQRGPYGGFALAIEPDQLTVYDVVQAIDPIHRIHSCPLKLQTHGVSLCALHRLLDTTAATVERSFRKVTISSLLLTSSGTPSKPLCEFPSANANATEPVRRT